MIYLDNAATTRLDDRVFEAMLPYLKDDYGNPSAIYDLGQRAKTAIENAREIMANAINAEPEQIVFTSGATESNNWLGMVFNMSAANSEHPSVTRNTSTVSEDGANVLSKMMVNNETGKINDIKWFVEKAKHTFEHSNAKYYTHTDATQAFGHVKIDVKDLDVDFLTLSAHKFHGPKGVGIMYIKNARTIKPLLLGGGQEHGMRSGTENVPAIVGMAKAAELFNYDETTDKYIKMLKYTIIDGIRKIYIDLNDEDGVILIPPDASAYYNISPFYVNNIVPIVFKRIPAENIVMALNKRGICCSTGSACHNNSSSGHGYSYLEMGINKQDLNSVVRFSLSGYNTEDEIKELIHSLSIIIPKERAIR